MAWNLLILRGLAITVKNTDFFLILNSILFTTELGGFFNIKRTLSKSQGAIFTLGFKI